MLQHKNGDGVRFPEPGLDLADVLLFEAERLGSGRTAR